MAGIAARTVLRISGSLLLDVLILAAAGWMVFVSSLVERRCEFIRTWGGKGSDAGQFSEPSGIAIAGDEVSAADSRNGRMQVFDLDDHFGRMFGKPGDQTG